MPGAEQEHVSAGCTCGDGKDAVFITLFYFSYPCTFGHAVQSGKYPIMLLGSLDEASWGWNGELASFFNCFYTRRVSGSRGHPDGMKSQIL